MYHYIPCSRDNGGGVLFRDPSDIREELADIRRLLQTTEKRMQSAESTKEELLLLLGSTAEREQLASLSGVVEDCEELKHRYEELWAMTDALSEELSDTLYLLGGRGGAEGTV